MSNFHDMHENDISGIIIDIAIKIHKKLGPGLLESVYESILYYELVKMGFFVERQKDVEVYRDNIKMDIGFRSDLIVERKVIVELKAVETLHPVFSRILFTYLKVTGKKLGLIINFGEVYLKNGIKRVVNGL